jgi:hypothetical protein
MRRDKNVERIVERDKSAVKQPMECTGKRNSVADRVWSVLLNRTNVCRLHLRPATTVNQSQS